MRILVVEDEPNLRGALEEILREEGYAVDGAGDGEDGLFRAESFDYDAIVLDLLLPRIDGWTVLERLRKTKRTPVLLLTAKDTVADKIRGLDSGADDYLVKPIEFPELLARLRALTRRAAGLASPVIAIGDVLVDTRARRVSRGGEAVHLTGREYALLELLAVRRGEVLSRTYLYEHLFDETEDSLSNLLDVHVARLRRKLGHDLVSTRRGQGYVIEPEAPSS